MRYESDRYESDATTKPGSAAKPGAAAKRGPAGKRGKSRRDPLWARLLVIFGALLMLGSGGAIVTSKLVFAEALSGVHQQNLLGDEANRPEHHATISGAKNVLLIGLDARPSQDPTELVRSDSIIIVHINAQHDQAYLVSIPRDTSVEIPPFEKTRFLGQREKINAAFAFGNKDGGGLAGGTELLVKTIRVLYGINVDAVAIVDFTGFQQVVKVLGGVTMYVDQETTSVHIGWDRNNKVTMPYKINADTGKIAYKIAGVTPKVYHVGTQHLAPWEALDYVRQRELLPNGDYDRERHQQQFIKAIFKEILSANTLSDPIKLKKVLDVVGQSMTVDSGPVSIEDWIFAMKSIGGGDLVTLKTNNGTFHSTTINGQEVESLDDNTLAMLAAVRDDTVGTFVANHPELVTANSGP